MIRTTTLMTLAAIAAATLLPSPASAQWGTLKGKFVFVGDVPTPVAINVTKDQDTCGKCELRQESLVVNPDNAGIRDIVVFLYPTSKQRKKLKVHPDYEAEAKGIVKVSNSCCRFEPHIVPVRTTQTLHILNPDPVAHNSKVTTLKNPAINPNIPAGGMVSATFPREEVFPSEISCSIHPWMKGYLIIKEHPYVAVSDENGEFELKNLPAGEWRFRAWHESGYVEKVMMSGKAAKWSKGRFEEEIKDGETLDFGTIEVAAAELK